MSRRISSYMILLKKIYGEANLLSPGNALNSLKNASKKFCCSSFAKVDAFCKASLNAGSLESLDKVFRISCTEISKITLIPPFKSSPLLRSEEHTSELQSRGHLVCRLLLEKKHTSTT